MARKALPADLYLLSKVSKLYYERGLNQQEIADKLHLSRPKVSRLLQQASQLRRDQREQGVYPGRLGDKQEVPIVDMHGKALAERAEDIKMGSFWLGRQPGQAIVAGRNSPECHSMAFDA